MAGISSSARMMPQIWAFPAFCVFPLALIQGGRFSFLPGAVLPEPVAAYLVIVLCAGLVAAGRPAIRPISWGLAVFALAAALGQALAMYASASYWSVAWSELLLAYGAFAFDGLVLAACAASVRLLAGLPGGMGGLWRGWVCAAAMLSCVCLVQAIWLGTSPDMQQRFALFFSTGLVRSMLDPLHAVADTGLTLLGWLCAPGAGTSLEQGAVPGVFDSGRVLVLSVCLLIFPLVAGLHAVERAGWKRRLWGGWLVCLFPLLVCTRSSLALFVAAFAGACLIAGQLKRMGASRRLWLGLGVAGMVFAFSFAAAVVLDASARTFVLRALCGAWEPLRQVVVESSWRLVGDHPFVGTGMGWSEGFIVQNDGVLERLGLRIVQAWRDGMPLPVPSWALRALAEFGAPLAGLVLASVGWLGWLLRRRAMQGGDAVSRSVRELAWPVFRLWYGGLVIVAGGSLEGVTLLFFLPLCVLWAAALLPSEQGSTPTRKSALATDPRRPGHAERADRAGKGPFARGRKAAGHGAHERDERPGRAVREDEDLPGAQDSWDEWATHPDDPHVLQQEQEDERLISDSSSRPFTL